MPIEEAKTPVDISQIIRKLYTSGNYLNRLKQTYRPYICPFHILVDIVPRNSKVLDIGCGEGVLLNLLAEYDKIASSFGFDANRRCIENAVSAKQKLSHSEKVTFQHLSVEESWPDQEFDVVTMIDVMHHINPKFQKSAFQEAVSHVKPGGLFIYKDMALKPFWMAWANRLHDLVLVQDWIHYVPISDINEWAKDHALEQLNMQRINMLWYGHELVTFRKSDRKDN